MNCLDIWEYFNNPFQGDDWDHVGTAKTTGAFSSVCLPDPEGLPREEFPLITAESSRSCSKYP